MLLSPRITEIERQLNEKGYSILRPLPKGGMGWTYLVSQQGNESGLCLKLLSPLCLLNEYGINQILTQRFEQEVSWLLRCRHDNIIHLQGCLDFVQWECLDDSQIPNDPDLMPLIKFVPFKFRLPFYCMVYCEGGNLRDKIDTCFRHRTVAENKEDALKIIRKVAEALFHFHQLQDPCPIHRDLKPENILFHNDNPIVSDFGLAKNSNCTITKKGVTLGNTEYWAPEQLLQREDINYQADIYALGIILYEMLTGKRIEIALSINVKMKQLNELKDPFLSYICFSMLATDIKDRFKTMNEVADAIKTPKKYWIPVKYWMWDKRKEKKGINRLKSLNKLQNEQSRWCTIWAGASKPSDIKTTINSLPRSLDPVLTARALTILLPTVSFKKRSMTVRGLCDVTNQVWLKDVLDNICIPNEDVSRYVILSFLIMVLLQTWKKKEPTTNNLLSRLSKQTDSAKFIKDFFNSKESEKRLTAAKNLCNFSATNKECIAAFLFTLQDKDIRNGLDECIKQISNTLPYLVQFLEDYDGCIRESVVWTLGKISFVPEVLPYLLQSFQKDPDCKVCVTSASIISKIHPTPPDVVKSLIDRLNKKVDKKEWRIRQAVLEALGNIGQDAASSVPTIIDCLQYDNKVPVRQTAAWALGNIGPAAISGKAALIHALRNDDPDVRESSAKALGNICPNDPEAAAPIVSAVLDAFLSSSQEPPVREASVKALGRIGVHAISAIPQIIDALHHDGNFIIRQASAEALGNIGPIAARFSVPALIVALQNDRESDVRQSSAEALGNIGPIAARFSVPALIAALQDKDRDVLRSVVKALGKIGKAAVNSVPSIILALDESDNALCKAILQTLVKIGVDTSIMSHLIDILKNGCNSVIQYRTLVRKLGELGIAARDSAVSLILAFSNQTNTVREVLWDTLKKIGPATRANVPWISRALTHTDPNVRKVAAWELGRIGYDAEQSVPYLIACLDNDSDITVRHAAAESLGQIGPIAATDSVPALMKALLDRKNNFDVRKAITWALGKIGPAAAMSVHVLIQVLRNENNPRIRKDVVWALGRLGPGVANDSVPALTNSLITDSDIDVQRFSAQALGEIGQTAMSSIPMLISVLRDNDKQWIVHYGVTFALGAIGTACNGQMINEIISALILALHVDKDWRIRRYAAQCLGEIGTNAKSAVPELIRALSSSDPKEETVAKAAEEALIKIGPPARVSDIIDFVRNTDIRVRKASILMLGKMPPTSFCVSFCVVNTLITIFPQIHDKLIRWAIIWTLENIGMNNKEAMKIINIGLKDSEKIVSKEAERALKRIQQQA